MGVRFGSRHIGVRVLDDVYAEGSRAPERRLRSRPPNAGIALISAAGGLFAVLTYAVGRRRRGFGIRLAIGATPGAICRLLSRELSVLAALGGTGGVLGH